MISQVKLVTGTGAMLFYRFMGRLVNFSLLSIFILTIGFSIRSPKMLIWNTAVLH